MLDGRLGAGGTNGNGGVKGAALCHGVLVALSGGRPETQQREQLQAMQWLFGDRPKVAPLGSLRTVPPKGSSALRR